MVTLPPAAVQAVKNESDRDFLFDNRQLIFYLSVSCDSEGYRLSLRTSEAGIFNSCL